jgi:glutamate dehydrogenase/leucine dehydrogenase
MCTYFTAALENQITKENAGRVKAISFRGGYGTTTPEAARCSSRGAVVVRTYLQSQAAWHILILVGPERAELLLDIRRGAAEADKLLTIGIRQRLEATVVYVEVRMAAYICAIERVTAAMKLKCVLPGSAGRRALARTSLLLVNFLAARLSSLLSLIRVARPFPSSASRI